MPDDLTREILTFAPQPKRVAFVLHEGDAPMRRVVADLYYFMDRPLEDVLEFYRLDAALREIATEDIGGFVTIQRQRLRLLCPDLKEAEIAAITPHMLADAITASFRLGGNPPRGEDGEASPSASPASTTSSPAPITGPPSKSDG